MKYENEEEIRKDFARIFDWYIRKNSYGYTNQDRVLKTPSWTEIFAEVGKLMEKGKEIITYKESNPLQGE